jgi:Transposase, Mutator family
MTRFDFARFDGEPKRLRCNAEQIHRLVQIEPWLVPIWRRPKDRVCKLLSYCAIRPHLPAGLRFRQGQVWPKTREQRCWVHKTANVLAKLPKSQQPKAKRALQEIWMAETKAAAELAFDTFIESYTPKYEKAADCLSKDRETLLAFYGFPAEHWKHLRTTNPIESTFATVRHRTIRSKGCLSNRTALAMVFKLLEGP